MRTYFVDTWYLIARFEILDGHHRRALAIDRRTVAAEFVTHDGVLTEFLTYFADSGPLGRQGVVAFVRAFMRRATVLPADRELFLAALARYERRGDKQYSLTDCMSMVVMEQYGITHVLTNDHHFRQEGFTLVNE